MTNEQILNSFVGKIASIKNVSGWAQLNIITFPDMPDFYYIGQPFYGHFFTVALVERLEISNGELTVILKGAE